MAQKYRLPAILGEIQGSSDHTSTKGVVNVRKGDSISTDGQSATHYEKQLHVAKASNILQGNIALVTLMLQEAGASPAFIHELERLKAPQQKKHVPEDRRVDKQIAAISSAIPRPSVFGYTLEFYDKYDDLPELANRILSGEVLHAKLRKRNTSSDESHIDISNFSIYNDFSLFLRHLNDTYTVEDVLVIGFSEAEQKFLVTPDNSVDPKPSTLVREGDENTTYLCSRLMLQFSEAEHPLDRDSLFLQRFYEAHKLKVTVERSYMLNSLVVALIRSIQYIDDFSRGELGREITNIPLLPIIRALNLSPALLARTGCEVQIIRGISPGPEFFEDILVKYFARNRTIQSILRNKSFYPLLDTLLTDAETEYKRVHILQSLGWYRLHNKELDEFLLKYGIDHELTDCEHLLKRYNSCHMYPVLQRTTARGGLVSSHKILVGTCQVVQTSSAESPANLDNIFHHQDAFLKARLSLEQCHYFYATNLQSAMFRFRLDCIDFFTRELVFFHPIVMTSDVCAIVKHVLASGAIDPIQKSSFYSMIMDISVEEKHCLRKQEQEVADLHQVLLEQYNEATYHSMKECTTGKENQVFWRVGDGIIYHDGRYEYHVGRQRILLPDGIAGGDYVKSIQQAAIEQEKLLREHGETVLSLSLIHSAPDIDPHIYRGESFSFFNGWKSQYLFDVLSSFLTTIYTVIDTIFLPRLSQSLAPLMHLQEKERMLVVTLCDSIFVHSLTETLSNTYDTFLNALKQGRRIPNLSFLDFDDTLKVSISGQNLAATRPYMLSHSTIKVPVELQLSCPVALPVPPPNVQTDVQTTVVAGLDVSGKDIVIHKGNRALLDHRDNALTRLTKAILFEIEKLANRGMNLLEHGVFNYENLPLEAITKNSAPNYLFNSKEKIKELILRMIKSGLHIHRMPTYMVEVPIAYSLDSAPLIEIVIELAVNSVSSDYVESIGLFACAYALSSKQAQVYYQQNAERLDFLNKPIIVSANQREQSDSDAEKSNFAGGGAEDNTLEWYWNAYKTTGYGINRNIRDEGILDIHSTMQESGALSYQELCVAPVDASTVTSLEATTRAQEEEATLLLEDTIRAANSHFVKQVDDGMPHFTLNPSKSEFMTKISGLFDCYDTFVSQFISFYDSVSVDPKGTRMQPPEYATGFRFIKEKRHMCLDYVEYCYQLPMIILEVCNIICSAIFNRDLDIKLQLWAEIVSNTVDLPYYSFYHSTSNTSIEDFDYVPVRPPAFSTTGASDKRDHSVDELDFDTLREITTPAQLHELSRRIRRGQVVASENLLRKVNAYYYSTEYWVSVRGIFDEGINVNRFLSLVGSESTTIMKRTEVKELITTEVVKAIIYYRSVQIFVQEHLFPDTIRYGFLCITTRFARQAMERRISAILCSLGAIVSTRAWTLIEYSNKITNAIQVQCSCVPKIPLEWHMLRQFIKLYIKPLQALIKSLSEEAMSYFNSVLTVLPLKELSCISTQADLNANANDANNWAAVLERLSVPGANLLDAVKYSPDIISLAKTTQFSWIFNRMISMRFRTDIVYQPYKLASYLYSSTSPVGLNKQIRQKIIPSAEGIISQSKYDLLMTLEMRREDLTKRQNDLMERVEAFTRKIPAQFSFNETSQDTSQKFFKESETLRNELNTLRQESQSFVEDEISLELAPGAFAMLDILQPRIDMIYRFWSITYEYCTILPIWFDCLLSDLILKYAGKLNEFEEAIIHNHTSATDILALLRKAMQQEKSKSMLASLNNGEKILIKVQSDLAWFKYYSPIILALLSPALKKRHLEQLRTHGIFLSLTEHTVSKLVERRVFSELSDPNPQEKGFSHRAKLILDVITYARKEHDIELSFAKVENTWKTVSFEFQSLTAKKYATYPTIYSAYKNDARNIPSVHPITVSKAKIFDEDGKTVDVIADGDSIEPGKHIFIIRNLDTILQLYQDHLLLTNKLLQSQHVTPIQRIIQQFTEKQFIIKEILTLIRDIQELWLKLYPIYVGEYTGMFGSSSTDFILLTICLQTVYLCFISNCNVQNNITIAGNLNQVDRQLEAGLANGSIRFLDLPLNQLLTPLLFYYRALLTHLNAKMYSLVDVKRRSFYRLTFMSTNEIIKLLSAPHGSPDAILTPLKHLYNLSDYSLTKQDNRILLTSVSSKSGEKIRLSEPVNVLAEVDAWLAVFDRVLRDTMRKLFCDLYVDVFIDNKELGAAFPHYPTCVVCLFIRAEITNRFDSIFAAHVSDVDAHHMSLSLLEDLTNRIVFFKQQFINRSNKLLYNNILVELMYYRNIVTGICKQSQSRDKRFIYHRIYKYRIVPLREAATELLAKTVTSLDENVTLSPDTYVDKDPFIASGVISKDMNALDFDVQVTCLSHSIFYRFDYIPPTNRSIITEPMDQAATYIFSFLASRSFGGSIKGEAGKTEAVKHIAHCLGYKPYILNSTYTVNFSEDTLHYSMLTACAFGLLVCFEDVENFTTSLLLLLARNMSQIYGVLNSYTTMQTLANCASLIRDTSNFMKVALPAEKPLGEASLHPSTIFFLTTNMQLPHSFNRVLKVFKCHLTDAAIHHIISTYMEIAGLSEVEAASSQIMHITGVIQRLFTPFFGLRYIKDIISEMLVLSQCTGKPWKRIIEQSLSARSEMSSTANSKASAVATKEVIIEQREAITSALRLVNMATRRVIGPLMQVEHRPLLHKMLDSEFGPIDLPPIEETLIDRISAIYTDPTFCREVFDSVGMVCPYTDLDHYTQMNLSPASTAYKAAQAVFIEEIKAFIDAIDHNIGLTVLGKHLIGKTGFITICSQVYSKLCNCIIHLRFINFASISYKEFFGHFASKDWVDGIIARLIVRAELHGPKEMSWIVCDGVSKMSHLSSILNGTMFLPNGEVLRVPPTMKFLFEVTNPMLIPDTFSAKCGLYQLGNYDYTEGYLRKLAYSHHITGEVVLNPLEVTLHTALQESLGEAERPRKICTPNEYSAHLHEADGHHERSASEIILERTRQLVSIVNLVGYVVMCNTIPGKTYRFYNMNLKHAHSANCLFTFTSLNCIIDMYYKVFLSSLVMWARMNSRPDRLVELVDICMIYSLYNSFGLILVTMEARQWFDWFVRLVIKIGSDPSRSLMESEALFIRSHVKKVFADDIIRTIQSLSKNDTLKPKLSSVVCSTLQLPSTIHLPTSIDMLSENVYKIQPPQLFFEMLFDPERFSFINSTDIIARDPAEYLQRVYALKYNTNEIRPSAAGLRYYILATMLLTCGYNLTVLGNPCSGKTSLIQNLFMANQNYFRNDFHILHIPTVATYSDADSVTTTIKRLIKTKMNMYTPTFYAPYPGNRTYLIFEDAETMSIAWQEVTREYQQNNSFYDEQEYIVLKDVVFLFVSKFSSDFNVDERYLKTSFFLPFYDVSADEMRKIISFKMKIPDARMAEKLMLCSYDLLHEANAYIQRTSKGTKDKGHAAHTASFTSLAALADDTVEDRPNQTPLVSLTALLNVSNQIYRYIRQSSKATDNITILRLWIHETFREFTDSRNKTFYKAFVSIIYTLVQKYFDLDTAARYIVPLDDDHSKIYESLTARLLGKSTTFSLTSSFMMGDTSKPVKPAEQGARLSIIQEVSTSDESLSGSDNHNILEGTKEESHLGIVDPDTSDFTTNEKIQQEIRHYMALPMFTYMFNVDAVKQGYQDESTEDFEGHQELSDNQNRPESENGASALIPLLKYSSVSIQDVQKAIEDAENGEAPAESDGTTNEKGIIQIPHAKRNSCFVTSIQTVLNVQRISRIIGIRNCAIVGMDGTGRSTSLRQAADNLRMVLIEFDSLTSTWTSFITNALTRSIFMKCLVIQLNQEDLENQEIIEDLEMYFSTGIIYRLVDSDAKITGLADYIKEMHMDLYGTLVEAAHIGSNELLIMYKRLLVERVRFTLVLNEEYYYKAAAQHPTFFKNVGILFFDYLDNATMATIVTKLIPDLKPEKFLLNKVISKLHYIGYTTMLLSNGRNRGSNFTKLFINLTLAYFSYYNIQKELLAEKKETYAMGLDVYNMMQTMLDINGKNMGNIKSQLKALEEKILETGATLKETINAQTEAAQAVSKSGEKVAVVNKKINDCMARIDSIVKPYANAVESSHQHLFKLSAKDLGAFKSLTKPNEITQLVFKVIYLLFENSIPEGATLYSYWIPCRKLVSASDFIDRATTLTVDTLKREVVEEITAISVLPTFTMEAASKTSASIGNLMVWCLAICNLIKARTEAVVFEEQLEQHRKDGADVLTRHQELKNEQDIIEKTVIKLRESLAKLKLEVETMQKKSDLTGERSRRINQFLVAFADIKKVWERNVEEKDCARVSIEDSLLVCSLINYAGAMPLHMKLDFLIKCRRILSSNGIVYTHSDTDIAENYAYDLSEPKVFAEQSLRLKRLLISEDDELLLVCRGLKADDNIIINAQIIDFIVNDFQCYPLIHDPHKFLLPWLTNFTTNTLRGRALLNPAAKGPDTGTRKGQEQINAKEEDDTITTVLLNSDARDFLANLRTELLKNSVVVICMAPSFGQTQISGINELLTHMLDVHTKILFYNTQQSNKRFQTLLDRNKAIRDYIYTIDISSYDKNAQALARLSSVCNPEIDAAMVKLSTEYLALSSSREQVIKPRLYQMLRHIQTSLRDPSVGELVLDDVTHFDKMLSTLEQYMSQDANSVKIMRRINENEGQRQEYKILASCTDQLRVITERLVDRNHLYKYTFNKALSLFESTVARYMEKHNVHAISVEEAEELLYESIYLLVTPSLETNEKILFELNMALTKELEGKLRGVRYDIVSGDILKVITQTGSTLDWAFDTDKAPITSKSLRIADSALQSLARLEDGYIFGQYLEGVTAHIQNNPEVWDKALDAIRVLGNTDLETYNPDIIRSLPSYGTVTETMPLCIWLLIIYHLNQSKFISVAKSYIANAFSFAKTNTLKDHITDTKLTGDNDWKPFLLLQTDPQMILDLERLARSRNIHITMLMEKKKLLELCTTRTWVLLPDVQFHDDHELHCLIMIDLIAIYTSGGMHRDFKLFFTLSDPMAKLSDELLLNSVKLYWSMPHNIKRNMLTAYNDHFKDIYVKAEADEMTYSAVMNKLGYWLLFTFFTLNERVTAPHRLNLLRFYDALNEIRSLFLVTVQVLGYHKIKTKGAGIVLGVPLIRAMNATKAMQDQGIKHYIPTEVECISTISFEGLYYIFGDLYMKSEIQDEYDNTHFDILLRKMINPDIFDAEKWRAHPIYSKFIINLQTIFNTSHSSNSSIVHEIGQLVSHVNMPELWSLDANFHDILAYREFCLFLKSTSVQKDSLFSDIKPSITVLPTSMQDTSKVEVEDRDIRVIDVSIYHEQLKKEIQNNSPLMYIYLAIERDIAIFNFRVRSFPPSVLHRSRKFKAIINYYTEIATRGFTTTVNLLTWQAPAAFFDALRLYYSHNVGNSFSSTILDMTPKSFYNKSKTDEVLIMESIADMRMVKPNMVPQSYALGDPSTAASKTSDLGESSSIAEEPLAGSLVGTDSAFTLIDIYLACFGESQSSYLTDRRPGDPFSFSPLCFTMRGRAAKPGESASLLMFAHSWPRGTPICSLTDFTGEAVNNSKHLALYVRNYKGDK